MSSEAELSGLPKANLRVFDVSDRSISPAALTFKLNRCLSEIAYDREVKAMMADDEDRRKAVDTLNDIGMALSTEKDLGALLDMIVSKSRQMTRADAGSLYLVEADPNVPEDPHNYFANKKMRFQVAQNDSRNVPFKSFVVDISKKSVYGYVALTQEHLNFKDVYFLDKNAEYSWGGREFDAITKYRTMSMLTVPMVNYRGETIGVLQLMNRKVDASMKLGEPETFGQHVLPFTEHDVRMARSIASQASIAIQNTQLVNSIRTLFDGFIAASVKAIESRDPTTSGHSQRVATLTVALAEQVDRSDHPRFKDEHFTREQLQEIRYASLLHDFGKIGVREHVLVKAKKLYPEEMQHLLDRFELIRTTVALGHARRQVESLQKPRGKKRDGEVIVAESDLQRELKKVEELLAFIKQCNEPTVLAQGGFERLSDIAKQSFRTLDGVEMPFLLDKELVSLSVPKGSLNENDRKEIESHVTHTYKFLTTIPWTADLRNVPDIAYGHHEKLDGSGYPNRLKADEILIQSKMMTIADIYDALTALDRPYKKALPPERALNILLEEAKSGHIDPDLLDIFIKAELYKAVSS
jgi:HD-GYP domain-containing protein (c-di-GMP phosphodiesterase class II)